MQPCQCWPACVTVQAAWLLPSYLCAFKHACSDVHVGAHCLHGTPAKSAPAKPLPCKEEHASSGSASRRLALSVSFSSSCLPKGACTPQTTSGAVVGPASSCLVTQCCCSCGCCCNEILMSAPPHSSLARTLPMQASSIHAVSSSSTIGKLPSPVGLQQLAGSCKLHCRAGACLHQEWKQE